jgi:chromate reductase, NAD(P)H dehydrogenase (quinone)
LATEVDLIRVRLLALCGSLRAASSNAELLRAAAMLLPPEVELEYFGGLAALPHFNPDDEEADHPAVRAWRDSLTRSGGVLVCSPEYAHGIPGALKNALDWVVGSGEFVGKPVALLNASPRASHAQEQLREVLTTMDARVINMTAVHVSGRGLTAETIAGDPSLADPIREAVSALVGAAAS